MTGPMEVATADAVTREWLAAQLDDVMVLSIAALRAGQRAYWRSAAGGFEALVVEELSTEFRGFGSPGSLVELMLAVPQWKCLEVEPSLAAEVAKTLTARTGVGVSFYGGLYYELRQPARTLPHPLVRRMGPADRQLFDQAHPDLRLDQPDRDLDQGIVVGAVLDGQLVARASCLARSRSYGDIGVTTLPECQGRGLATAAAARVARTLQQGGLTPVWSTGETNWASQRVADKLGFTATGRTAYVIPDQPLEAGR